MGFPNAIGTTTIWGWQKSIHNIVIQGMVQGLGPKPHETFGFSNHNMYIYIYIYMYIYIYYTLHICKSLIRQLVGI